MTDRVTLETGHRLSLAVIAALALVAVPARSAPAADKVAPVFDAGKVWPIHITLSAEEFAAIQPRGGLGFGPAPKEPAKPADPAREVHRNQFGAERAFALLDQKPDVDDPQDALPLARAAGAIEFRGVSFAYRMDRKILVGASFSVESETRLGVVGATGAGKTTLLNLLMRFYDPSAGQVLLDGRDVRDYRLADLRLQFALVLQDTVLFSGTIAENIAYARPDATRDEIEVAARAACSHDFITRLPQGYDTLVGERGMCLSGGERQRVAIARAFL